MTHVLAFLETEPNGFRHINTDWIIEDYKRESGVSDIECIYKTLKVPITLGDMYNIIKRLQAEQKINFIVLDNDSMIIPKVRGADLRVNQISVQYELKKIVEVTNIPIFVCSSRFV